VLLNKKYFSLFFNACSSFALFLIIFKFHISFKIPLKKQWLSSFEGIIDYGLNLIGTFLYGRKLLSNERSKKLFKLN